MYMILLWIDEDFLRCIENPNGSVRLFKTLKEADKFAEENKYNDDMRVISIEAVKE